MDTIFQKIMGVIVGGMMAVSSFFTGSPVDSPVVGATIPTVVAVFQTSLAASISTTDTSMTLVLGTDKAGNAISGYICFNLDEGTAVEEFVCGTASSTAVTGMIRGIDPVDGVTERSALKKRHGRGASVKITNFPQLAIVSRALNGTVSIPNKLWYSSSNTFSSSTEIVSKGYVDGVAIAGAPDAASTTIGITKLSIAAASTTNPIAVGDNDTRVPPINTSSMTSGMVSALAGSSSTPSSTNKYVTMLDVATTTTVNAIVRANSSGTIDPTFVVIPASSSSLVSFLEEFTSVAATTTFASTTIKANSITSNGLVRVTIPVIITPSAGAGAANFTVVWGNSTTTLSLSCAAVGGGNAVTSVGNINIYITNRGTTTTQLLSMYSAFGWGGAATNQTAVGAGTARATTTINTASDQSLKLYGSAAGCTTASYPGLIELIK